MNETLKYLRQKNNLSQNKVADYLGISRQMYIKYESGETEPTVKCVRELSRLYSVTYDVLIDDKYKDQNKDLYSERMNKSAALEVGEPEVSYSGGSVTADSLNYRNTLQLLFKLNADDLIKVASKALRLVEEKKNKSKQTFEPMSQDEKIALFNKLSGSIENVKQ